MLELLSTDARSRSVILRLACEDLMRRSYTSKSLLGEFTSGVDNFSNWSANVVARVFGPTGVTNDCFFFRNSGNNHLRIFHGLT